jgi:hypothetical protein
MYYSSSKQWGVGDEEDPEGGEASYWLEVASTALTPDQIDETWRADDGVAWLDAAKVMARMCSAA